MAARLRERAALFAAIPQLTQLRRSGRVSLSQSLVAKAGPALAAHAGEGALGIATLTLE